jgi:hypothetical protein
MRRKISPVEYAREHGRSLAWIYKLIWLGQLPAKRVDGRWLIDADTRPRLRNERKPGQRELAAEELSA